MPNENFKAEAVTTEEQPRAVDAKCFAIGSVVMEDGKACQPLDQPVDGIDDSATYVPGTLSYFPPCLFSPSPISNSLSHPP